MSAPSGYYWRMPAHRREPAERTETTDLTAPADRAEPFGPTPTGLPWPAVTIVGAGMTGAACATVLRAAGRPVRILERAHGPGGRMASPTLHGRRVDIGAGYFTVRDSGFAAVVDRWASAGLARPWTDTFTVLEPGQPPRSAGGPVRWAGPGGLRSLVRALLQPFDVQYEQNVDVLPEGDVVLAMPDPQAARLVDVPDAVEYRPVITVVCGFDERSWPVSDAAFVNDHPDLAFVADDGARRGDGAAVLVVHSTAAVANRYLTDPERAVEPVVAGLTELLGTPAPRWTHVHRWTFAQPDGRHDATFGVVPQGTRSVYLGGDQWCPDGSPRVESAWRSGTDLAEAILATGPSLGDVSIASRR